MRLLGMLCIPALLISCSIGQAQSNAVPATVGGEPAEAMVMHETPEPVPANVTPKTTYNSVNVDGPYIALTFDDGPHRTLTPKLLDLLKEKGVKATFFVVGQNVAEYPDIVRRIVREGHELGNHSWSHPSFTKLSLSGVRSQLERTNSAVEEAAGVRMKLVRPPYGATSAMVRGLLANEYGLTNIMWSVDPLDWKYRSASRVTNELTSKAAAGAILLAHDIHASTVDAMPATIDRLLADGYRFLTVSELIAREVPPAAAPSAAGASSTPAAAAALTPDAPESRPEAGM